MEVSLHQVSKRFEGPFGFVDVLSGVDLKASRGESLSVMGPSGSGKSTLLHIMGVLDEPTSGQIDFDGCDPMALAEHERAAFRNQHVGFVFQDHHLLPQFTVLENTLLPALASGAAKSGIPSRAISLLERVGLAHRLHHRPGQLSGGERQRVAIARAMVNQPELLLCDEPTGNLDQDTARQVTDVLFEMQAAEQTLIVIVTHSQELAARCGTHFQLVNGQLVGG